MSEFARTLAALKAAGIDIAPYPGQPETTAELGDLLAERWAGPHAYTPMEGGLAEELAVILRAVARVEREACAQVCESVHRENRRMGLTSRTTSDEASAVRNRTLFEDMDE